MARRDEIIEDVRFRFTYTPPSTSNVAALHGEWNRKTRELAEWAATHLPEGRPLTIALTELEASRMRGNQAIALDQQASDTLGAIFNPELDA